MYTVVTDEEPIATACHMYWETDEEGFFAHKLSEIVKITGLAEAKIHELAQLYTAAFSEETACIECSQPYEYENRADYQSLKEGRDWRCESCVDAIEHDPRALKRFTLSHDYTEARKHGCVVESTDFISAAMLFALIKHSATEDMTRLRPLKYNTSDWYSPMKEFTAETLSYMVENKLICIDPESNLDRVEINTDGTYSCDPLDTRWAIAYSNDYATLGQFYLSLEDFLPKLAILEASEAKELILELSVQECFAYMEWKATDCLLPFKPGDKLRAVLEYGLKHYSVAQMYFFLWCAAESAISFHHKKKVSIEHAANSIVGNIERRIDKYLAEGKQVDPFERMKAIPQSALSRAVFNTALGTFDGGFVMPLSELFDKLDNHPDQLPKNQ
jgi:hypothetical protein